MSKTGNNVCNLEPDATLAQEPGENGVPMNEAVPRRLPVIRAIARAVLAASVVLLAAFPVQAGTGTASPQLPVRETASVPAQLGNPEWVREKVLGTVSDRAVRNHVEFDRYYASRMNSARGYALEAESTITVNSRMRATGKRIRWIPSSTINGRHSAVDIYEVDTATGKILRRIQAKAGAGAAWEALRDARYKDMHILTTRESYYRLLLEVKRAEARGRPLNPKYAALKKAIESGRLMARLPCGAPLPEVPHLDKVARTYLQKRWNEAVRASARAGALRAATTKPPARSAATALGRSRTKAGATRPAAPARPRTMGAPKKPARFRLPSGNVARRTAGRMTVRQLVNTGTTNVTRAVPVVVGAVEVGRVAYHAYHGDMKGATKAASGAAGGVAGAKAGAAAGAAIGSFAGPVGTLVGGAVGAVVGGAGGAAVAEKAAEKIYDWVGRFW